MMNTHQSLRRLTGLQLLLFGVSCAVTFAAISAAEERVEFIPLPDQAVGGNPLDSQVDRAISTIGSSMSASLPDSFVIRNNHGLVQYDDVKRTITYSAGVLPIYVRTGEGQEMFVTRMVADMNTCVADLEGPLVIYQGDTLTRAEHGSYDWEKGESRVTGVHAKADGLIIRGSSATYGKNAAGKTRVIIEHAFVTTEDVEKPGMWVGTGTLTVYPGDYGVVSRLSISGAERDMAVPILGWFPVSHSLNPDEGYMPVPGAKSTWGLYLENRYGFLIGNRRVEHEMPVADYLATARFDYRARRGLAGGMDFSSYAMRRRFQDTRGLQIYVIPDKRPDINPVNEHRTTLRHNRYRVSAQAMWSLPVRSNKAKWTAGGDINVLSDRYVLQDFFEDEARLNDKPDNNIRVERRTPRSSAIFFTRFSPNDFYSSDERAELSYYRPRTVLGLSHVAYETRNSAAIMHQNIPAEQRQLYLHNLDRLRSPELKEYYTRLLNSGSYVRVNSTHEASTSVKILQFLNVTPKAGGGYTGYYNVEGVGADNRVMGYLGCDFDIKFYRYFPNVQAPWFGISGLYHIIHPYAEISHGTISSSNDYVPQVDTWSSTLGSSTVNPMPLDLMEFTGIDGWGHWTVWRLGMRNTLSTVYDGESCRLLDWNMFLDYNVENPNTETRFSNLYSLVSLRLTSQCTVRVETQTPTVRGGDGFNQYNTSLSLVPLPWLETQLGHRYISSHPIQHDANYSYLQVNVRLNERYTAAVRVSWDFVARRVPIQQFSITRKFGPWYLGTTVMLRDNGGRRETGMGISFTLGETGTSLPVNFF